MKAEGIDFSVGQIDSNFHLNQHTYLRFLRARAHNFTNVALSFVFSLTDLVACKLFAKGFGNDAERNAMAN
jgi:hypothetical protein